MTFISAALPHHLHHIDHKSSGEIEDIASGGSVYVPGYLSVHLPLQSLDYDPNCVPFCMLLSSVLFWRVGWGRRII
jgi:hypothetical protein